MNKIKRKISVVLVVMFGVLCILGNSIASYEEEKIITTWNKKPVSVRNYIYNNSKVIGEVENGTTVKVKYYVGDKSEWAVIKYENTTGYIKTQYLTDPEVVFYSDIYNDLEIKTQWDLYYPVENPQYTVVAKPKRTTGFVYLRYTPEEKGKIAKRMRNDSIMTVMAEMGVWYQVREEESGIIGFVKIEDTVKTKIEPEYIRMIQDSYD